VIAAKSPRTLDLFIQALEDESSTIREWAADALGKVGDSRAVPALVAAAENEEHSWSERKSALEALNALGWKPSHTGQKMMLAIFKCAVNLPPGSKVPFTGEYKCEFCDMRPVALDPRFNVALDQVMSTGRLKATVDHFEAGTKFSECPRCKEATGWTVIRWYNSNQ